MSSKKTYREQYNDKYNKGKDVPNSKAKISRQTGISKRILDQVYDRGTGAFYNNRGAVRKSVSSPQQWSYGRIYSFALGGKTQKTADKDLWEKHLENMARKKKRKEEK